MYLCFVQHSFTQGDDMEVVLRKYGNSTVMALPPGLLKNLGLKAGQAMTIDATPDGRMSLTPVRRYSLVKIGRAHV